MRVVLVGWVFLFCVGCLVVVSAVRERTHEKNAISTLTSSGSSSGSSSRSASTILWKAYINHHSPQ